MGQQIFTELAFLNTHRGIDWKWKFKQPQIDSQIKNIIYE